MSSWHNDKKGSQTHWNCSTISDRVKALSLDQFRHFDLLISPLQQYKVRAGDAASVH